MILKISPLHSQKHPTTACDQPSTALDHPVISFFTPPNYVCLHFHRVLWFHPSTASIQSFHLQIYFVPNKQSFDTWFFPGWNNACTGNYVCSTWNRNVQVVEKSFRLLALFVHPNRWRLDENKCYKSYLYPTSYTGNLESKMKFDVARKISNKSQYILSRRVRYRLDVTISDCWLQCQKQSITKGHKNSEKPYLGKKEDE